MIHAAVFGASGGIGSAVVDALAARPGAVIHAGSRGGDYRTATNIQPFAFDLTDEGSIARAFADIARAGPLDLIFVATGMLHRTPDVLPEKSFAAINVETMLDAYRINTIGPALIAKHAIAYLPRNRRAVFAALSARVGSISDNRLGGWHSYRASKAALNMIIANLAIELRRTHPEAIAVALHPGTVATALSKPFQRNVSADQLTAPETSAAHLLNVVDSLTIAESGTIRAWDGSAIPA